MSYSNTIPQEHFDTLQRSIGAITQISSEMKIVSDDLKAKGQYSPENPRIMALSQRKQEKKFKIYRLPGVSKVFSNPDELPEGRNELNFVAINAMSSFFNSNKGSEIELPDNIVKEITVPILKLNSNGSIKMTQQEDENGDSELFAETETITLYSLGESRDELSNNLRDLISSAIQPYKEQIQELQTNLETIEKLQEKVSSIPGEEYFKSIEESILSKSKESLSKLSDPLENSKNQSWSRYVFKCNNIFNDFVNANLQNAYSTNMIALSQYGNMLKTTDKAGYTNDKGDYVESELSILEIFKKHFSDILGKRLNEWFGSNERNFYNYTGEFKDLDDEVTKLAAESIISTDLFIKSKYPEFSNLILPLTLKETSTNNKSLGSILTEPGALHELARGVSGGEKPNKIDANSNSYSKSKPSLTREQANNLWKTN
jgi:hypothetical protein